MAEPTLAQVFGANATQSSTTLTISKADLAAVGLTASSSNTAESLLVAIVLFAQSYLTETNQNNNTDQSVTVVDGYPSIVFRNDINYRVNQRTINISKVDSGASIDPDDY